MLELQHQLWQLGVQPARMYVAAGGGGTHGGIVVGAALYGADYPITGVLVEDDAEAGVERAWSVAQQAAERLGRVNPVERASIVCDDSQVGPGYGIATDAGLEAIRTLAHSEAVLLDPVYTAKAFAALLADVRSGAYSVEDSIIFLHTGGSPLLFAQTELLRRAYAF